MASLNLSKYYAYMNVQLTRTNINNNTQRATVHVTRVILIQRLNYTREKFIYKRTGHESIYDAESESTAESRPL